MQFVKVVPLSVREEDESEKRVKSKSAPLPLDRVRLVNEEESVMVRELMLFEVLMAGTESN